ncbi:aspartate racemase [Gracilibacillus halophilus YIM-C55.5]|uniref:Aspartate racemase n=1 Tax=Gracilibacillus halophilus YIM-C55.5 TaxID=1308866 RepID=N4WR88_9BACI|nr:amino acid racemase [Gracilibacillus halophilus]ENH95731.1 aspartate racemase [Gracilibacillus halophilus YIM-C55.5]
MNKVGIIGGLGPESTVEYYQSIIKKYQQRLGSQEVLPELVINSINMYQVFTFISNGNLDGLADYLTKAVNTVDTAGADFAIISANTPHIVFEKVQENTNIPLISIVEETYKQAESLDLNKMGLIGTKFTMEHDFFKQPFRDGNTEIIVPHEQEQQYIHEKIVAELENGIVNQETKQSYLEIIERMRKEDGIEGIILGCTELPMIIKEDDLDIPELNTTDIHINRTVDQILHS